MEPYRAAAAAYDLFYRDKDYEGEVDEIACLVETYRPDAQSVLDVGCGTGAHLAGFARRYERAEGIEPSARMIEEATIARPGLLIYPGDMRTFQLRDRFDVVTCLFSAIGYMTTVEDLHLAVRNMAAHLAEGGVLVVEGWVEREAWEEPRARAQSAVDDELVAARVMVSGRDGDVSTIEMHYLLATVDGIEYVEEVHRMGLFTAEQYRAAVEAAGLRYERTDGLTGRGLHIGIRHAGVTPAEA
ncbi:MAG: class I SAM-dependent methyltransferase [Acidimicrobiia bacterium]